MPAKSPRCASAFSEDTKSLPQLVTILRVCVKDLQLVRGLFIDFGKPNEIAYPSVIFNHNSGLSLNSFLINVTCKIEMLPLKLIANQCFSTSCSAWTATELIYLPPN